MPVVIPHHGAKCISKLQITKAEIRWSALGGQNDLAGVVVRIYCPDLGGVCFVEVSNVLALQRLSGFLEVVRFLEGLLWEVPLYKLRHKM